MRLWLSIVAVTMANWLLKAAGPLVLGKRTLPRMARDVVSLMAPVLLAGLIVVELAGPEWESQRRADCRSRRRGRRLGTPRPHAGRGAHRCAGRRGAANPVSATECGRDELREAGPGRREIH
jgi:hypothetical protein